MSVKYQSVENSVKFNKADVDLSNYSLDVPDTFTWWDVIKAKFIQLGYRVDIYNPPVGVFFVQYDDNTKVVSLCTNPPCTDRDLHIESNKSPYYNPYGPFFELKDNKPELKIGSYVVEVKNDGRVHIGCQNFDINDLKRAAKTIAKVRNVLDEFTLPIVQITDEGEGEEYVSEIFFNFADEKVTAGGETHDLVHFDMLVKYVEAL